MTINHAMNLLIAELVEGDVPAPLSQAFTLAAVWSDLARLAGEPLPRAVAVLADLPVIPTRPGHGEPVIDRAACAAWLTD